MILIKIQIKYKLGKVILLILSQEDTSLCGTMQIYLISDLSVVAGCTLKLAIN